MTIVDVVFSVFSVYSNISKYASVRRRRHIKVQLFLYVSVRCRSENFCLSHNMATFWLILIYLDTRVVDIKWHVACNAHLPTSKIKVTQRDWRSNLAIKKLENSYISHKIAINVKHLKMMWHVLHPSPYLKTIYK